VCHARVNRHRRCNSGAAPADKPDMTTITPLPTAIEDVALADERVAGALIGLVFAAVVVAFLVGLFLF
jgi:hypothetical protein